MAHGKILIVDDEANLRHTLMRVLQTADCEVNAAATGAEALQAVAKTNFDLIYLDIHLPDLDGLEVLKQLSQKAPNTPVILFTAHASVQSAVDAMRLGAVDYLIKPIDPANFIARTRVVIAEQGREKRKRELREQIAALQTELAQLEHQGGAAEAASPLSATPHNLDRFFKRGALILDLQARRGTLGERVLNLPPAAFDYLVVLMKHAPETVDYLHLVNEAQGYQTEAHQARELAKWHIHQIREALEPDPEDPQFILNVRGVGYRLVVD